ncbi:MAG TPA: hypothetical protein VKJ07_23970, partial [Mycobacteriales bacterium]|nr:hypothetical protein [Mycobacteriales bacterium]
DEVRQPIAIVAVREIEQQRFVAGVQKVVEGRVAASRTVRSADSLDLDDFRPGAAEQRRTQRAGPQRGEIDHQRSSGTGWTVGDVRSHHRTAGDAGTCGAVLPPLPRRWNDAAGYVEQLEARGRTIGGDWGCPFVEQAPGFGCVVDHVVVLDHSGNGCNVVGSGEIDNDETV